MVYVSYDEETGVVTGVYTDEAEAASPYITAEDDAIDAEDYEGYTVADGELVSPDETAEDTSDSQNTDIILTFTLSVNGWTRRTADGESRLAYDVATEYAASNSVFYLTGVNRGVLVTDLDWSISEGLITFLTDEQPLGDVVLHGVISVELSGDNAQGTIDAWPQSEWRTVRYRHSLHDEGLPLTVPAHGSVNLETTPVSFANAVLLYAFAEWSGNNAVMIPHYYINASSKHLVFTLHNTSNGPVVVQDVLLRLVYSGTISGLIEESDDQAAANV